MKTEKRIYVARLRSLAQRLGFINKTRTFNNNTRRTSATGRFVLRRHETVANDVSRIYP